MHELSIGMGFLNLARAIHSRPDNLKDHDRERISGVVDRLNGVIGVMKFFAGENEDIKLNSDNLEFSQHILQLLLIKDQENPASSVSEYREVIAYLEKVVSNLK